MISAKAIINALPVEDMQPTLQFLTLAAKLIYVQMTERQPLRDGTDGNHKDRTRYDRLCNLYRLMKKNSSIPEQWELDDVGCPQYMTSYTEKVKHLTELIQKLEISQYPQKTLVLSMISRIEKLYVKLEHRNAFWKVGPLDYLKYRSDGFECMFFNEMFIWLGTELTMDNVYSAKTAQQIQERLNYCNRVYREVLFYRDDQSKHVSPKETAAFLIGDLEELYTQVSKSIRAASFNEKIHEMHCIFMDTARNTFTFLFALLNQAPSSEIQIRDLLEHARPKEDSKLDSEIQMLTPYLMYHWIIETLDLLGVKNNTFEGNNFINFALIKDHISDDFLQINLRLSGLWPFACTPPERAKQYLQQIRQIHQRLVELYFVENCVMAMSKVSSHLGDSWVYGEDAGKPVAQVLKMVIERAHQNLNDSIRTFWNAFYERGYRQFSRNLDNRDECYSAMILIEDIVTKISGNQNDLNNLCSSMLQGMANATGESERIKNILKTLKSNLYLCVQSFQLDISSIRGIEYVFAGILHQADSPTVLVQRCYYPLGTSSEHFTSNVTTYNCQQMPVFSAIYQLTNCSVSAVREYLEQKGQWVAPSFLTPPLWCEPDITPRAFYSQTQEKIYHFLCHAYHEFSDMMNYVLPGAFFQFSNGICWSDFVTKVCLLLAMMYKLYSDSSLDRSSLNTVERDTQIAMIDCLLYDVVTRPPSITYYIWLKSNTWFGRHSYASEWPQLPFYIQYVPGNSIEFKVTRPQNWQHVSEHLVDRYNQLFHEHRNLEAKSQVQEKQIATLQQSIEQQNKMLVKNDNDRRQKVKAHTIEEASCSSSMLPVALSKTGSSTRVSSHLAAWFQKASSSKPSISAAQNVSGLSLGSGT